MADLRAFVVGSTGQVGMALVNALAKDPRYSSVKLIQRRQTEVDYGSDSIDATKRFSQHVIDFDKLENYADLFADTDVGFCALGTTQKVSGKDKMRVIDHDYVIQIAKLCCDAGCKEFHFVSTGYANPNSSNFYLKLKGQTEADLEAACTFPKHLVIYRPSVLLCNRTESRPLEYMTQCLFKFMNRVTPTTFGTPVEALGKAMSNAPFDIERISSKPQGETTKPKVYLIRNPEIFELANPKSP